MAAKGNMRFALTFCLVVTLSAPAISGGAEKDSGTPWIVAASIIRNGGPSGSGVYLKSGLIITAAHLTDAEANMGVHIAGVALPANVVKQGSFEDVDLSLLSVDQEKLPARIGLFQMQLCEAPPWPGDPVIVVDSGKATRSHIISPQVLPFAMREQIFYSDRRCCHDRKLRIGCVRSKSQMPARHYEPKVHGWHSRTSKGRC